MRKIIRVFPRKTNATPNDDLVYFDSPTLFSEADEIHVSVAFTYDLPKAEQLANQWSIVAPVKIGGPAFNKPSGEFEPGMYIKKGYTITSRGCPNKCWFCSVWKREGNIRELEIKDGWNVLDDNLLACSDQHIINVFKMLEKQTNPIEFTGGLEAKILKEWHVDWLVKLKVSNMFFAYDTPDDFEPLVNASNMLRDAGIITETSHRTRCYVLIGHPKDTFDLAEKRLKDVCSLGIMPMAMLWRNEKGIYTKEWKRFQREWANPFIVGTKIREMKIYA